MCIYLICLGVFYIIDLIWLNWCEKNNKIEIFIFIYRFMRNRFVYIEYLMFFKMLFLIELVNIEIIFMYMFYDLKVG